MYYEIAYTPKGKPDCYRDWEGFKTKYQAITRANVLVATGATKIFVDIYNNDEDMELIEYIPIN